MREGGRDCSGQDATEMGGRSRCKEKLSCLRSSVGKGESVVVSGMERAFLTGWPEEGGLRSLTLHCGLSEYSTLSHFPGNACMYACRERVNAVCRFHALTFLKHQVRLTQIIRVPR